MSTEIVIVVVLVLLVVAVTLLARAGRVSLDPAVYRQRMERAQQAQSAGQVVSARAHYSWVAKQVARITTPTGELTTLRGQALLNLGHVERAAGQPAAALAAYQQAIQLVPVGDEVLGIVAADYATREQLTPAAMDSYVKYVEIRRKGPAEGDPILQFLRNRCESAARSAELAAAGPLVGLADRIAQADPDREWAHFLLAMAAIQRSELDRAVAALRRVGDLAPDRADAAFALGQIELRRGNSSEAYAAFRRSLRSNPSQPEALELVGEILIEQARLTPGKATAALDEAVAAFEKATALAPRVSRYWSNLAQAYRISGRRSDAREPLVRAVRLEPANVAYHEAYIALLEDLDDRPALITELRALIAVDRKQVAAHERLGQLLLEDQQWLEAAVSFQAALTMDQTRLAARRGLGQAHYALGRYSEAVAELADIPDQTRESLYTFGRALGHTGQFEQARDMYHTWLDRFGPEQAALFYLGCSLAQLGDWPLALVAWVQAKDAAPRLVHLYGQPEPAPVDLLLFRAVALGKLGRFSEALASLAEAERIAPADWRIPDQRGAIAFDQDDLSTAQQCFVLALQKNANDFRARFGLGAVAERKGNLADAVSDYRTAVQLAPAWETGRLRLGIVLARSGNDQEALSYLDHAEISAEANFWRGEALYRLGQYAEAITIWNKVLNAKGAEAPTHAALNAVQVNIAIADDQMARLRFAAADYAEATAHWEQSRRILPEVPGYAQAIAEAKFRTAISALFGSSAEPARRQARQLLADLEGANRADRRSALYLGIDALFANDPVRSISLLEPLVDDRVYGEAAAYYLAFAYLTNKQLTEASAILAQPVQTNSGGDPNLAVARANLAVLAGGLDEALDEYARSLVD
jgi:tetratricopeptide (TPR) repeat protein